MMIKVCPICKKMFESTNAKKFCSLKCVCKARKPKEKKRKETLCWTCKNAVCGCSWSKDFTPVEGWEAIPTKVRGNIEIDEWLDSYLVVKCPRYEED